jgi:hypothetical protein
VQHSTALRHFSPGSARFSCSSAGGFARAIVLPRTLCVAAGDQCDQVVMQMNEARQRASDPVQRARFKVISMIDKPGHPDRPPS